MFSSIHTQTYKSKRRKKNRKSIFFAHPCLLCWSELCTCHHWASKILPRTATARTRHFTASVFLRSLIKLVASSCVPANSGTPRNRRRVTKLSTLMFTSLHNYGGKSPPERKFAESFDVITGQAVYKIPAAAETNSVGYVVDRTVLSALGRRLHSTPQKWGPLLPGGLCTKSTGSKLFPTFLLSGMCTNLALVEIQILLSQMPKFFL